MCACPATGNGSLANNIETPDRLMDNQRLLVWSIFAALAFLTWQAWLEDYAQPVAVPVAPADAEPALQAPAQDALPAMGAAEDAAPALSPAPTPDAVRPESSTATLVRVSTDVFNIEISTVGATLAGATLNNYPVAKDRPDDLVELLSPRAANLGLVLTGVRIADVTEEPTEFATFRSERQSYDMGAGDVLEVPFTWTGPDGHTLEKRFRFRRGSYAIEIEQRLTNRGSTALNAADYARIRRVSTEPDRSMFDVDSYSFVGPIIYDGEKSEKLDRDDLLDDGPVLREDTVNGWVASIQHHFLTAIVPPRDAGLRLHRQSSRLDRNDGIHRSHPKYPAR